MWSRGVEGVREGRLVREGCRARIEKEAAA